MDIAPELYEKIMGAFRAAAETDSRLSQILKDVESGSLDFSQAYEAAHRIGTHAAEALIANLNSDILPNGKMYYNIATRTIEPVLRDAYEQSAEIAASIQTNRNKAAGLGLKAVKPEPDGAMLQDFINKICAAEDFDEVSWMLNEPATRYPEEAPLDTTRENADFQSRAGVQAKIIRTATRRNCEWCASKAGEYKYPQEVKPEIFQKHDNCSCVVEYDPGIKSGKRQDVFSKKWIDSEERNTRVERAKERAEAEASGPSAQKGATSSGAKKNVNLDPGESYGSQHAKVYYEEVRNRAPYSDAKKIAKNTGVFDEETVERIRRHMFINEQPRDGRIARFDPDYDQARAWQRLVEGKNIAETDILMLKHEKLEMEIMEETGCQYEEAHSKANEKYNWWAAVREDTQ